MGVALLVLVLGGALAIAVGTTWYLGAARRGGWPPALVARRGALGERVARLAARPPRPARPVVESSTLAGAAAIEADLLGGRADRALAAAEHLVAAAPDDAARHHLLARALLAADQPLAAAGAARRAADLGATGARLDLTLGLAAHRARAARSPAPAGAASPYPALLTPHELFMLELERHRRRGAGAAGGGLWLAAHGDASLSGEAVLAAVTEHVAATCDELERLLAAAEADPDLPEAGYHAARLAVKLGLVAQARELFAALEPAMAGSGDEGAYRADLAVLADRDLPPLVAPPPIASGRRAIGLKILK